jgi:hypothetical protein
MAYTSLTHVFGSGLSARSSTWFRVVLIVVAMLLPVGTFPSPAIASDRVFPNSESVKPLGPGAKIPTAVVRTVLGEPTDLSAAIGESGALLVFYRGGW